MTQSWPDSRRRSATALALARRSSVLDVAGAVVAVLHGPEDRLLVSLQPFAPVLHVEIAVKDARFYRYWWPGPGSNRRPSAFQADARTN